MKELTKETILQYLREGNSAEDIAAHLSDMINDAEEEYEKEKTEKSNKQLHDELVKDAAIIMVDAFLNFASLIFDEEEYEDIIGDAEAEELTEEVIDFIPDLKNLAKSLLLVKKLEDKEDFFNHIWRS